MKKKIIKSILLAFILMFMAITPVFATDRPTDCGIGLSQDFDYMPQNESEIGNFKLKWTDTSTSTYSKYVFYRYINTTSIESRYTKLGEAPASAGEIILHDRFFGEDDIQVRGIDSDGLEHELNDNYNNTNYDIFIAYQQVSMDMVHGSMPDVEWLGIDVEPNITNWKVGTGDEEARINTRFLHLKDFSREGDLTSLGTVTATMYGSSMIDGHPVIVGEKEVSFNIVQRDFSKNNSNGDNYVFMISEEPPVSWYTGEPHTYKNPQLKIYYTGGVGIQRILIDKSNYDVSYEDNVGKEDETTTAKIKFTGKNNCTGVLTLNFSISKIYDFEEEGGTFTVEPIDDQLYTGYPIEPTVKVIRHGSFDSYVPVDKYTVEFDNNIDPGMAMVTVTGRNGYKGRVITFFNIVDPHSSGEFDDPVEMETPKLSYTANNNTLTLRVNDQPIVQKYVIYKSTDNKKWSSYKTIKTLTYTIKDLKFGQTYYYKVKAYDGKEWSAFSNVVKKKIVPNKVTNLIITSVGTNNIKIKYDKVATTGYQIYMGTKTTNMALIKDVTSNSTLTYNKKKLKTNKTYYFKVRAYKKVDGKKIYGSWSAIVSTKTAPIKPTLKVSTKSYTALNIKVGEAKGATRYIIQRSIDKKTYETATELAKYGTYGDLDLTTGKTYYYRVKACNSQNRCSGWVTGYLKVKPSKTAVTLKTTKKQVQVTLKAVTGADGYEIYRATSEKGTYKLVKTITSDMDLTYINKTATGKTYYYKARVYSLVNGKKIYSDYTGIKSIKSK